MPVLKLRAKPLIGEFIGENVVAINFEQRRVYFFDTYPHGFCPKNAPPEDLVIEQYLDDKWVEIEL